MSMLSSIRSTTTPASATAGPPATSRQATEVAALPPPAAAPRRASRLYRSLAVKAAVLAIIFLAVPIIVYDQFRAADEAQKAVLIRSVREQGRVMAQALAPLLSGSERPALPQLGRELARFADELTNVKLIFSPPGESAFFYVASWPAVPTAQLDAERAKLQQQGVLERLGQTCEGELPFALRYST